jgi:hypothetical protein
MAARDSLHPGQFPEGRFEGLHSGHLRGVSGPEEEHQPPVRFHEEEIHGEFGLDMGIYGDSHRHWPDTPGGGMVELDEHGNEPEPKPLAGPGDPEARRDQLKAWIEDKDGPDTFML